MGGFFPFGNRGWAWAKRAREAPVAQECSRVCILFEPNRFLSTHSLYTLGSQLEQKPLDLGCPTTPTRSFLLSVNESINTPTQI